jgi:hypothetical protein
MAGLECSQSLDLSTKFLDISPPGPSCFNLGIPNPKFTKETQASRAQQSNSKYQTSPSKMARPFSLSEYVTLEILNDDRMRAQQMAGRRRAFFLK